MRRQNGFRDVLAISEFRALLSAEIISVYGDQVARVAVAVLVFDRTSSAALTALTYALTFVPALLGGVTLAGLADRFPRRAVLICSDLVRAVLAGAMVVPSLPLPVLWALVFTLALAGTPFKAAQLALLPNVLAGERYPVGLSVRMVSTQVAQLVGFATGGSLLLVVSPRSALGINAATFVLSALIVRAGTRARPAASRTRSGEPRRGVPGFRAVSGSRELRVLIGLVWLAGITVAPEGIAAPYATGLGGTALAVGLLLAADPLGSALGAWISGLLGSASARTRAMVPAAIVSGLVLIPCAVRPGLVPSLVLWSVCGACSTLTLIQAQSLIKDEVPDTSRAAVFGLASGGLQASQGLAVLAAGVLGQHVGVYRAVGAVGVVTAAAAVAVGVGWKRARPGIEEVPQGGHGSGHVVSETRVRGRGYASGHLPSQTDSDSNKAGRA